MGIDGNKIFLKRRLDQIIIKYLSPRIENKDMKIACIGWGSLIWSPRALKSNNEWFEDGPLLPIEFTRISSDDRVTLIIDEFANPIRTYWSTMKTQDMEEAIASLQEREKADFQFIHWTTTHKKVKTKIEQTVMDWLEQKQLDAAIWTGLGYSEKTGEKRPIIGEIFIHLQKLDGSPAGKIAEEYIRRAPRQTQTAYRKQIEQRFGWTPIK